ncbi:MAG: AI-2E family transporter, partial [Gammaproteobacteria bacterium]|nr:AI-2E family transporter [Gammaproteobacteria bacterium]
GLLQVGQEAQSVLHLLQHAHQGGLPTPDWILGLPKVGPQAAELWQHWLGSSAAVKDLLKQLVSSELPHYTRQFASLIFHRYASAFFTFVVLFFLLLNGELLGRRVLYLCDRAFGEGKIGPGLGLFVFGLLIIILSDNYLKPKLIGNAVKLPFIWTLLGILGGIETFGFLGLFLGPTIMAILISVWRDSLSDSQDGSVARD